MTTFDRKPRPIEERIADLLGRTSHVTPSQGLGGIPSLSDQDIAAALVWCRRHRKDFEQDLGPELLLTYYGSDDSNRSVLRAAYLRAKPITGGDDKRLRLIVRRLAATIAVQLMAGKRYSRQAFDEYAFIVNTRGETFRREVSEAEAWLMSQMGESLPRFREAVRDAVELRIEHEREERAYKKSAA